MHCFVLPTFWRDLLWLRLQLQLVATQQLQMKLEKVDFVRLCLPCFLAGHIIMMCAVQVSQVGVPE